MGVQYYKIFGRQVGSHYLAIATILTTGALATWGLSGEKKELDPAEINARSKEEERFIQEFIKSAEEENLKAKESALAKAKH